MKATPAQQLELLRLQEHDNRLTRIGHTLTHLPQDAQLAALQPQEEALRRRLAEATGAYEDAQTEQTRLESDVAVVDQRLKRDQDRLQTATSSKDIEALEAEIVSLKRRRSDIDDAELEVMERSDAAAAALAEVRAEQESLTAARAQLEEARAAEVARLERERDDARADRMVVAQGIDLELLDVYERQRARYGIGAAAVRGGVNLGSNMTLSPSDVAAVRAAADDDLLIDSESGAILVRAEQS